MSYEAELTGYVGSTGYSAVADWASSLESNTTYHYRLYATSSAGTEQGADTVFTTQEKVPPPTERPSATTEAATEITSYSAKLNGSVNPKGSSTTFKFEYGTSSGALNLSTGVGSAGSGTASQKVEAKVNLDPGTKYYFRVTASNPGGKTDGSTMNFTTSSSPWKIKTTPNPESATDTNLYDVSCEPSTSVCTSVGKATVSGADRPVAQRWNGSAWSEQSPAKKSGTLPTRLFGVDCPSETRCLAAGNYQPSEGGPELLTEIWNEGKWSVQTTPVPSESTASEFAAIGCNSTANCTAVGSAVFGGVKTAIAERWTSPTWALSSIPIPEGAKSSQLDGVDCIWSNFCVAVGRYTNSSNAVKSLVVFWNGTSWALQTLADPAGATQTLLLDVSCTPTPSVCTAVGSFSFVLVPGGTEFTLPLVYRFTGGTTWTRQTVTSTPEIVPQIFQDVSCASETSCTAVGGAVKGSSSRPLAETWNGSGWSIQGTPTPAGTASSGLFGVSCRSTTCMAVGWGTSSSGVDSTLAEFRE